MENNLLEDFGLKFLVEDLQKLAQKWIVAAEFLQKTKCVFSFFFLSNLYGKNEISKWEPRGSIYNVLD